MGMSFDDFKSKANALIGSVIQTEKAKTPNQELMAAIESAKREWQQAEARFNEVTDRDLIDNAIYDMMSAKTRYAYLLRDAKNKGLHL